MGDEHAELNPEEEGSEEEGGSERSELKSMAVAVDCEGVLQSRCYEAGVRRRRR